MDLLRGIERFVQVVETGGVTAAARSLGMTPGMVSVSVSDLERYFGTPLFSRAKRRLDLTPEGMRLYSECKGILAEVEGARTLFLGGQNKIAGRLHVEASATVVRRLILPLWNRFSSKYPDVELELNHTGQVFGTADPFFDVAVRMGPFENSDLVAKPIGHASLWTVASPGYLARHGAPRTPDELRDHHCLNYVDPANGRVSPLIFERGDEHIRVDSPGKLVFNADEPRIAAALEGTGVLQTVSYQVETLVWAGRLDHLLREWIAPAPPITLLFHKDQFLTASARAFIDLMTEAYPPGQPIRTID